MQSCQMDTIRAGLIGRGIGASGSPDIHQAEARELGIPLTYEIIDFDAQGLTDSRLEPTVRTLAGSSWTGCNVTHPFKQQAIAMCDAVSEEASTLGAVNTLTFRDGQILGNNTDWIGFSWMIERQIGVVKGDAIAQMGAGGAGSATAYALGRMGVSELAIYDPSRDRCIALVDRLRPIFPRCRFLVSETPSDAITGRSGIVQTTPVGMAAHPGVPFPPELMQQGQWLADIIYFPRETPLLAAARIMGMRRVNGVAMVIGQAAEAFYLFTGQAPDRERMLALLAAEDAETLAIGGEQPCRLR
jgi:shikimate dehydrogenase